MECHQARQPFQAGSGMPLRFMPAPWQYTAFTTIQLCLGLCVAPQHLPPSCSSPYAEGFCPAAPRQQHKQGIGVTIHHACAPLRVALHLPDGILQRHPPRLHPGYKHIYMYMSDHNK